MINNKNIALIVLLLVAALFLAVIFFNKKQDNKNNKAYSNIKIITGDYTLDNGKKLTLKPMEKLIVKGKLTMKNGSIVGRQGVWILANSLQMDKESKIISENGPIIITNSAEKFNQLNKELGQTNFNNPKKTLAQQIASATKKIRPLILPASAQNKQKNIISGTIKSQLKKPLPIKIRKNESGDIYITFNKPTIFKDLTIQAADGRDGKSDLEKNCQARGGYGERGSNIYLTMEEELIVKSAVLNLGNGGNGGGASTIACSEAEAIGGDGGNAGRLRVFYDGIKVAGILTINPGLPGDGGSAYAYGSNGKDGDDGLPGGNAKAKGGRGGDNVPFVDEYRHSIDPYSGGATSLNNITLTTGKIKVAPIKSGRGGDAVAKSGNGGNATKCKGKGGVAGGVNAMAGNGGKIVMIYNNLEKRMKNIPSLTIEQIFGGRGQATTEKGKNGKDGLEFCNDEATSKDASDKTTIGCVIPTDVLDQAYPPDVFKRQKNNSQDSTTITFSRDVCVTKSLSSLQREAEVWLDDFKQFCPLAKIEKIDFISNNSPCSITYSY